MHILFIFLLKITIKMSSIVNICQKDYLWQSLCLTACQKWKLEGSAMASKVKTKQNQHYDIWRRYAPSIGRKRIHGKYIYRTGWNIWHSEYYPSTYLNFHFLLNFVYDNWFDNTVLNVFLEILSNYFILIELSFILEQFFSE